MQFFQLELDRRSKKYSKKYCNYVNLNQFRLISNHPEIKLQQSIEDFLKSFNEWSLEKYVNEIFNNRQRTSSRNGILKAEAVNMFCEAVYKYGVNYLQYVKKL